MRDRDLELLCCVDCGEALAIEKVCRDANGDYIHGLLTCKGCSRKFPVLNYVLIAFKLGSLKSYLSDNEISALNQLGYSSAFDGAGEVELSELPQVAVAENWEYQWNEVMAYDESRMGDEGLYSEDAIKSFIPIRPDNFIDKTVFVGCGGRGRESYHFIKFGASKVIVNELGREIYSIPKATGIPHCKLLMIRGDIRFLPVREKSVDISVCDHALQHVIDHTAAFRSLVDIVKPGGLVAICVYSWENNFIMTHMVEPLKFLLCRIPIKILKNLSVLPAIAVTILIHTIYIPLSYLSQQLVTKLPLAPHFLFWSKFTFRDIWGVMFDLLHAPVSYHFKRSEVLALASQNNLKVQVITNTNRTLWSLVASSRSTE